MRMNTYATIDAYIKASSKQAQPTLKRLRLTIRRAAPKGEEAMRYGMPTLRLNGKNLVYFAAFKKHFSFFPGRGGIAAFIKEAKPYMAGKGTLRFSFGEPVPYGLVTKIVKFRVKENQKTQ